jgi:pyruvate,water dikinase
VTVDCTQADGKVWEGELDYEIKKLALANIPKTKTKVFINIGVPEKAFSLADLPVDGVGLAREEFIITSHIGEHPLEMIAKGRGNEFIDKLAAGIAKIACAFYPKPVVVRLSDFKTNEYASLAGGKKYEFEEANALIGWRGASRYTDPEFEPAFRLECKAFKKAREEMGLTNIIPMIPFCRTVEEGKRTLQIMASEGLEIGKKGLEIWVMAEIPSNVILADEFARLGFNFSVGSNDLTMLCLGIDRDNAKLAKIFDERNPAVLRMLEHLIKTAHKYGRKVSICGDAPSTYKDYAEFLVKLGIDSISVTPDVAVDTKLRVAEIEKRLRR